MDYVDDGGPWVDSSVRGAGSRNGFNPKVCKFYVSNIPLGCRPWDLANAFRGFGEIVGAFIAKKKDKLGKTFGFVSFKGVQDAEDLERRMGNMKLGGNKLLVNIARFAKENGVGFQSRVGGKSGANGRVSSNNKQPKGKPSHPLKVHKEVVNGRSFVDILLNKSCPVNEEDVVEVDPSFSSLVEKFGRALVGRTRDFSALRKINVLLKEAGFRDIEIQYLGGLSVLLSFVGEMEAKVFAEGGEVWSKWFVSIDPWVGQAMPFERLAWINIFGVPPHIFSSKIFNVIGGRFGRLVHESQAKDGDGDLTFDCVGVLTDNGNLISGFLKLKWQDKNYRVWVNEEPSAWVPDCTGNINDLGEKSSEFSYGGRPSELPVGDVHVENVVEQSPGNNEHSLDHHGDSKYAAHGVVNEGPLHVDKRTYLSQSSVAVCKNRGINSTNVSNSRDSFNDCWANKVGQLSGRPKKRKRTKFGESNFFEDMVDCADGSIPPSSQQDRCVDSTETVPQIVKNRWGAPILMGRLQKIPLLLMILRRFQ
ncbi:putative RNA recognition motif domain, nucleotide-binding alpha-beta plait domain superfamily [Helianthus annuus]|uniref:RNA recognition motif domain, nucleotide-binding alpha-beta plait domain superfamily n=1 Tax=Helianthus annuus TaxID=4232 RepID=A0A9K3J5L6_HELAN|nr:putative RNA recognition motif domain, nucleotide-binding alpha-beta plait domain superfamily [Helianthus annuus]KAJ0756403.1 putative RNA recognition motif domain, nucleotide-binding alpha-beta plait domain superfamily [Helianthus annuus]KAJ0862230.1 putative RNA recognition motif domain, nucleotide-binding alpha-beta plait domain superfamily [Helianthus annuus]KAJ0915642.1 putative RNA recognition motif domain, nucleotide-binding alpha-beta plait domain superfamily [Helianthus annuus]